MSTTLIHPKTSTLEQLLHYPAIVANVKKCFTVRSSARGKAFKTHSLSRSLFRLRPQRLYQVFVKKAQPYYLWCGVRWKNKRKFRKAVSLKFGGERDSIRDSGTRPLERVFALKLMEKSVLLSSRCCRFGFLKSSEMSLGRSLITATRAVSIWYFLIENWFIGEMLSIWCGNFTQKLIKLAFKWIYFGKVSFWASNYQFCW